MTRVRHGHELVPDRIATAPVDDAGEWLVYYDRAREPPHDEYIAARTDILCDVEAWR